MDSGEQEEERGEGEDAGGRWLWTHSAIDVFWYTSSGDKGVNMKKVVWKIEQEISTDDFEVL